MAGSAQEAPVERQSLFLSGGRHEATINIVAIGLRTPCLDRACCHLLRFDSSQSGANSKLYFSLMYDVTRTLSPTTACPVATKTARTLAVVPKLSFSEQDNQAAGPGVSRKLSDGSTSGGGSTRPAGAGAARPAA